MKVYEFNGEPLVKTNGLTYSLFLHDKIIPLTTKIMDKNRICRIINLEDNIIYWVENESQGLNSDGLYIDRKEILQYKNYTTVTVQELLDRFIVCNL